MAVTINAKTTDVHHPAVQCDTYETVAKYVNLMPCIFISAFRGDPCREDYSEQLLKYRRFISVRNVINARYDLK